MACVKYGEDEDVQNVALECVDCSEVLIDFDATKEKTTEEQEIIAYFDGYGKSNSRDYCTYEIAVLLDGKEVNRFNSSFEGTFQTSQVSEYMGAINAVRYCNKKFPKVKKILRGDSKLVINQQGTWKTKEKHLVPLRDELKKLLSEDNWELEWVESRRNYADLRKFKQF